MSNLLPPMLCSTMQVCDCFGNWIGCGLSLKVQLKTIQPRVSSLPMISGFAMTRLRWARSMVGFDGAHRRRYFLCQVELFDPLKLLVVGECRICQDLLISLVLAACGPSAACSALESDKSSTGVLLTAVAVVIRAAAEPSTAFACAADGWSVG